MRTVNILISFLHFRFIILRILYFLFIFEGENELQFNNLHFPQAK
jgi:hypothetical protein